MDSKRLDYLDEQFARLSAEVLASTAVSTIALEWLFQNEPSGDARKNSFQSLQNSCDEYVSETTFVEGDEAYNELVREISRARLTELLAGIQRRVANEPEGKGRLGSRQ